MFIVYYIHNPHILHMVFLNNRSKHQLCQFLSSSFNPAQVFQQQQQAANGYNSVNNTYHRNIRMFYNTFHCAELCILRLYKYTNQSAIKVHIIIIIIIIIIILGNHYRFNNESCSVYRSDSARQQ